MAIPVFDTVSAVAQAASNAGLNVALPTGDPTGEFHVVVITSSAVGTPTAPAGWAGPFGSNGVWVFTKIGELADSGGTAAFAPWTAEVISTPNLGVRLTYEHASAIDVISAVAAASIELMSSPQVIAVAAATVVLDIFSVIPDASSRASGDFEEISSTAVRLDFSPAGASIAPWLAIGEETRVISGKTTVQSAQVRRAQPWRALTVVLRDNLPPNAPNLLTPAPGAVLDTTIDQTFTWQFSDPDAGDSQSDFIFEIDDVLGGGIFVPFVGSGARTDQSVVVPAGTLAQGDPFQWRVSTYDSSHLQGPYSAARSFTTAGPPAAPIVTSPTAGATVATPILAVGATQTDAVFPPWQVRRTADLGGAPDLTTIYFDSGPLAGTAILSYTLVFDATGRDEHVQVRYQDPGTFLWSPWTDVLVHVAFTPPPVPSGTVTGDNDTASMTVAYSTPAPTGSQPVATSVDILMSTDGGNTATRLATGLPITGSWTFWTPASGVDYWWQVAAVADDTARSFTDWAGITLIDGDHAGSGITVLIDPGGATSTLDIIDGGAA